MKQNEQRYIFKIDSNLLKKNKWDIKIDFEKEKANKSEKIITINESQAVRWIDDLRSKSNMTATIRAIKAEIRKENKTPALKKLYNQLDSSKFLPDLVSVVFPPCGKNNTNKDFDRACKGFTINGADYVRFIGTPNGIKKCSVLFIKKDIHGELMHKIENGRDHEKELIPAKLEAYRALTCSGSLPIPAPNGVIVVKDCITKFREDVIVIKDSKESDEPILTYENDYEIEHNNSDGFGLMLPSYAVKINQYINNDPTPLAGMVIRYAWTKGLLVPFDFIEFAENVAGSYEVMDVWGQKRDVREADVILTESMLKLWDSYDNWEDYEKNCHENGYEWAVTKTCANRLEDVRTSNYQFLNPFDFSEQEINELCAPTINQIKDIMQLDHRKTMTYLIGENHATAKDWQRTDDLIMRALMVEPETINDPYIRQHIWNNIRMKIERAKKGKINLNANYAVVCGDPYALAESIFNLPALGLLSKSEVYHKYWIDKGANEIACFRAPMTNINNIRKMKLNKTKTAAYWFRYINTVCVLNAWDSTFEAENGADADGDMFYCTDNPIILSKTENLPTIISIQNKAKKAIPTEENIIESNKLAFSDEIGKITNIATQMINMRSFFPVDSEEYKILTYRILCAQHQQQAQIDKAKGAETKPMPEHWKKAKSDDPFDYLAATKKPYFMIYVYPELQRDYKNQSKLLAINALKKCNIKNVDLKKPDVPDILRKLEESNHKDAAALIEQFRREKSVDDYGCTVNLISHLFEREMADFKSTASRAEYDYSILKSGTSYSKIKFNKIKEIYNEYRRITSKFKERISTEKSDNDDVLAQKTIIIEYYKAELKKVCPDQKELADIVVDMVYSEKGYKTSSFAWEMCGETIIENLESRKTVITYPIQAETNNAEFEFDGRFYKMVNEYVDKKQFEEQIIDFE